MARALTWPRPLRRVAWTGLGLSLLAHGLALAGLALLAPPPARPLIKAQVQLCASLLPAPEPTPAPPAPPAVAKPAPPALAPPRPAPAKPTAARPRPQHRQALPPAPSAPILAPLLASQGPEAPALAPPAPPALPPENASPDSQAPGAASSASPSRAGGGQAGYYGLIMARLERVKRYPEAERRLGSQGRVMVRFVLARGGELLDCGIAQGSGRQALDQEVLRMVRAAAPFPPFPQEMARARLTLLVPVDFSLR